MDGNLSYPYYVFCQLHNLLSKIFLSQDAIFNHCLLPYQVSHDIVSIVPPQNHL